MELKYEYRNETYNISIKSIEKIEARLKVSLKRRLNISINEYLKYLGFDIECCRICKIGDVPVKLNISIVDNFIKIIRFEYAKKVYCYGNNPECYGIRLNSNSFEFISKVENITIEEAKKVLKSRNSSPFYIENWDSKEEYKEYQSRDINFFINKYGEEEGYIKYNNYVKKISYSNSLDRYINEYGKEMGEKIFKDISNRKDSMSYDFFLKKNKNDTSVAIAEYNNRLDSVNVSVEKWVQKYGYKEAIEKHKLRVDKSNDTFSRNPDKERIYKLRSVTIDNLYNKYGDYNLALDKYFNWLRKVTVPLSRSSKESLLVFNYVIKWCLINGIDYDDIYIGTNNKNEFFIKDGKNIFFYDFTIRSKKIIIEYNGVKFHPKNENSNWVNPFDKKITSEEAYNKQKYKINLAENNGFSILEIWSDGEDNYNICIDFIKKTLKI